MSRRWNDRIGAESEEIRMQNGYKQVTAEDGRLSIDRNTAKKNRGEQWMRKGYGKK